MIVMRMMSTNEDTIGGDDHVGVGESVQAHQEELHLEPPLCLL